MIAPLGLRLDDRFVRTLPVDPDTRNVPRQVRGACCSRVSPTPTAAPTLLAHSPEVAALLGIPPESIETPLFAEVFGGSRTLDGMAPYAACYGGHQFGGWAGQLGDGRAITLGEVLTASGRQEIQLKGAGPTPYSRRGDGRAVLRSSIREFLCSEAMAHLGVPTTRALSLVTTGDDVPRDMFYTGDVRMEPGAVVCRVAPSFLRFGSYQIHAARGDHDLLRRLLDDTIVTHFPHLGPPSTDSYLAWLAELSRSTALMIAHWMRVGFVHGVMNTDNMSILGLTIDYGPYGWIDIVDHDWTPNTTDAGGRRYRFGHQPGVGAWNLTRLAEALYPLIGEVAPLEEALSNYTNTFPILHRQMTGQKLGLTGLTSADDEGFLGELTAILHLVEVDMTRFYRALPTLPVDPSSDDSSLLKPIEGAFYNPASLTGETAARSAGWLRELTRRAASEGRPPAVRQAEMRAASPKYVLRNYLAQQAITKAEAGDPSEIERLLSVLRRPYDEQPEHEAYAALMPDWARDSPGCSMLSCSS
ncbi:MAG: hypothetical protein ACI8S6_004796 [Myxococcota bacterium]|jgi:uncharacterized protein YdiU (UPF0061 family)